MRDFFNGFVKRAEEKKRDFKKYLPGLVGAGTAVGLYAAIRSKVKNPNAEKVTQTLTLKKPKTAFGHWLNKALYSADDIVYLPNRATLGGKRKPKKIEGILIHNQSWSPSFAKAKKELGSTREKAIKQIADDKRVEARLLNRLGASPKNYIPPTHIKGNKALKKLDRSFGDNGYLVKHKEGYSTGVGGQNFINDEHIADYMSGKKVPGWAKDQIEEFKRSPKSFVAQEYVHIPKQREFRVHALGKHVIEGASHGRTGYSYTKDEVKGARNFMKRVLKKLPGKYNNMFFAADVAKTDKGYKIIELNPGAMASGFMDVKFIGKERLDFGIQSHKSNKALYKHLTGEEAAPATRQAYNIGKGIGSVGAGAATAGLTKEVLKKYDNKKDRRGR